MSFLDLENLIKERDAIIAAAAKKIADRKAYKAARTALNKKKAARPPMYRPDRPVSYTKVVVLNVRRKSEGEHGELLTVRYPIDTVSDSVAELAAQAKCREDGYIWRGTVDILQEE